MSSQSRLYIPALSGIYEPLSPYAELLLRGGLGAILIVHGLQKFFAWFGGTAPVFLTYVIASLETFGGALLGIGLFVRNPTKAPASCFLATGYPLLYDSPDDSQPDVTGP